eukprot:2471584-Prymnesium_polylepis.2
MVRTLTRHANYATHAIPKLHLVLPGATNRLDQPPLNLAGTPTWPRTWCCPRRRRTRGCSRVRWTAWAPTVRRSLIWHASPHMAHT